MDSRDHCRASAPAASCSGLTGASLIVPERFRQISPAGVCGFDQCDFPGPQPVLQPAFPLNGGRHQIVNFVPDQKAAIVFRREPGPEPLLVLMDAPDQIVGDADIDRAILAACHYVDGYAGIPFGHEDNQRLIRSSGQAGGRRCGEVQTSINQVWFKPARCISGKIHPACLQSGLRWPLTC